MAKFQPASTKKRAGSSRSTRPRAIEVAKPDWRAAALDATQTVRACMFYVLNVNPKAGRSLGIDLPRSTHQLAAKYDLLLKLTAKAVIARNPLLQPLLGQPTTDRAEVQQLWLPLEHFVTLINSDLSPYASAGIDIPSELKELEPPRVLTFDSGAEILKAYGGKRLKSSASADSTLLTGVSGDDDVWSDPEPVRKERYMQGTLGLLLLLLEELAQNGEGLDSFVNKSAGITAKTAAAMLNAKLRVLLKEARRPGEKTTGYSVDKLRARIAEAKKLASEADFR